MNVVNRIELAVRRAAYQTSNPEIATALVLLANDLQEVIHDGIDPLMQEAALNGYRKNHQA